MQSKVEYTLHEVIKNRIKCNADFRCNYYQKNTVLRLNIPFTKVFFSSNKLHYLINVTADQEINIATGLSLAHAITEVN
ncbi:hypothetical protein T06_15546 [Trichinella sp. T6]|nr:hypothetical protein T06_15546 [Trichinella sp. T6]